MSNNQPISDPSEQPSSEIQAASNPHSARKTLIIFTIVAIISILLILCFTYWLFVIKKASLTNIINRTITNTSSAEPKTATSSTTVGKTTSDLQQDQTATWILFTNTKYKYSFKYPNNYEVVDGVQDHNDETVSSSVGLQSKSNSEGNIFFVTVSESTKTLSGMGDDLNQDKSNSDFTTTQVGGINAISYKQYDSWYLVAINNVYLFGFVISEKTTFDSIVQTFKFL